MDVWQVVGGLGVVFTSAQLVPQVVKSVRTRQVRDLSLGLAVIVGLSAFTWTLYGLHLRDVPLVVANAVNLVGASILLVLKLQESRRSAHEPPAETRFP